MHVHSVTQVVTGINNSFRHGYDAYSDDQVVDQSIGLRVGKGMGCRVVDWGRELPGGQVKNM